MWLSNLYFRYVEVKSFTCDEVKDNVLSKFLRETYTQNYFMNYSLVPTQVNRMEK